MLQLAIYDTDSHRFQQAPLAPRGVVLLMSGEGWRLVDPPADGLKGPWIELRSTDEGVRCRVSADPLFTTEVVTPTGPRALVPTDRLTLPVRLACGTTHIELIEAPPAEELKPLMTLERRASQREERSAGPLGNGPAPATLTRWFEAVATLSRWSVGSGEFWQGAASLVIDPLGFDAAYVVERDPATDGHDGWRVLAANITRPELGIGLELSRLNAVIDTATTQFDNALQHDGSAWAIAPWRDEQGSLAGVIVGVRKRHEANARGAVRHLEANLVRLVADVVTSGVVRHAHERRAARRQTLLELAFSPQVAQQIESDERLLDGARREVSVLFADLRDFSRRFHHQTAAGLGPVAAYKLLSEVMDALSEVVVARGGHLIDYYGDGLAALWNAPLDQSDHVVRACEAALACAEALEPISTEWLDRLGGPLGLGVGVHTGSALVGNVGSRWRIKYGARGETMNLASRVERATKTIGVSPIVSAATVQRLAASGGDHFHTQRLCRAHLAGIEQATDLYLLTSEADSSQLGMTASVYAAALAAFEADQLEKASRLLRDAVQNTAAGFLARCVERSRNERQGRRVADRPDAVGAIISLVEA
ncbi:adenylate/guanylate cyclase domain-containing protein [Botrimarina hoheduenensis]|uniref:Adenylate cyclase 1 n=1 Tax=Botrimarina hoheduenensis TaxID=2528000 RepID=A0A5C5VYC0_9BACT|nr:adenylate/guanylate cyclase domain-containing protein [Botrimarina hoheduenensis]TWT43424.1 Adenylate cyclase 1 [Botrimarina hoheduenensis]